MAVSELRNEGDIRLPVPQRFRRGSLRQDPVKSLQSGLDLLDWVEGVRPLAGARILDFGCGVKIAQALCQRGNPQALYVGLDVAAPIIAFLQKALADAPQYRFETVPFQNDMYNREGEPMTPEASLPVAEAGFDLLLLFSVITHMVPRDTDAVLRILRRHAAPGARLIFWAFADPDQQADFIDEIPDRPLLHALYRRDFLETIVVKAGWRIEKAISTDTRKHRKVRYVCAPVAG